MSGEGIRSALKPHLATLGSVLTGAWGQIAVAITGPVVARLLGVENRGELALLLLIPIAICQLGSLGLPQAIPYFGGGDRDRIDGVARSLVKPAAAQILLLTLVHGLVLLKLVADKPVAVRGAAAITMLIVPSFLLQQYGLALMQAKLKFRHYYVMSAMPATGYAVVVLICLATGQKDLRAVVAAWVGVNLASGLATLTLALKDSELSHRTELGFKRVVGFGLAGLLGTVAPVDNLGIDQLVAGLFLSSSALGLYVVGVAFANFPRTIGGAIGLVCYPRVAAEGGTAGAWKTFLQFLLLSTAGCGSAALVLYLTVPWLVPFFFGAAFEGSVPVARILLVAGVFQGVRRTAVDGLRGLGRPVLGTIAEIISLVVLFGGLGLLTGSRGVTGVALAYTIASGAGLAFLVAAMIRVPREEPHEPVDLTDEPLVAPSV